jgi:hypothetical protein
MSKKNGGPLLGAVRSLSSDVIQPNPQRVAALKQWHIDQAISELKPVAIINITLTACGQVSTKGIGLEPEHARVMLPALEEAALQLRQEVGRPDIEVTPSIVQNHSSQPARRKRELIDASGCQCQHCSVQLPASDLYLDRHWSHQSQSAKFVLLCGPCQLSVSATRSIEPIGQRLKLV